MKKSITLSRWSIWNNYMIKVYISKKIRCYDTFYIAILGQICQRLHTNTIIWLWNLHCWLMKWTWKIIHNCSVEQNIYRLFCWATCMLLDKPVNKCFVLKSNWRSAVILYTAHAGSEWFVSFSRRLILIRYFTLWNNK